MVLLGATDKASVYVFITAATVKHGPLSINGQRTSLVFLLFVLLLIPSQHILHTDVFFSLILLIR